MKESVKKKSGSDNKGPVIPAGTEQETGLTRGQTEKPGVKKPKPKKKLESDNFSTEL